MSSGPLNVHLKGPAGYELMERTAARRGLTAPAAFMANQLNEEMREINQFEETERRLLTREPLAIEGEEQEPEDRLDEDAAEDDMPRQVRRLNLEEFIRYE
jgi:hypothetical protein